MSDNKKDIGSPDNKLISLKEKYEVRYWTTKFGVSKAELENAIKETGSHSVQTVEEFLMNNENSDVT